MPYRASAGPRVPGVALPRRGNVIALVCCTLVLGGVIVGSSVATRRSVAPTVVQHPIPTTDTSSWNYWIAEREDPAWHIVFGSMRFDMQHGYYTSATDRPAEFITSAVHVPAGWVFVTAPGGVYGSDSFLGRLRPLGELPCNAAVARHGVGRAVAIDARGHTWSTDGRSGFTPMDVPDDVIAASFIDERHGMVIVNGGTVLSTDDGGDAWTPMRPGDASTWRVMAILQGRDAASPSTQDAPSDTASADIHQGDLVAVAGGASTSIVPDPAGLNARHCIDLANQPRTYRWFPTRGDGSVSVPRDDAFHCTAPAWMPGNRLLETTPSTTVTRMGAVSWTGHDGNFDIGWRGEDAHGSFIGHAHRSLGAGAHVAPGSDPDDPSLGDLPSGVLEPTRAGVLLTTRATDTWLWASATGEITRVMNHEQHDPFPLLPVYETATPDGGVVVLLKDPMPVGSHTVAEDGFVVERLVTLDAHGAVQARRDYYLAGYAPVGEMCMHHGVVGVPIPSTTDAMVRRCILVDGTTMDLPRLPDRPPNTCGKPGDLPVTATLVLNRDLGWFNQTVGGRGGYATVPWQALRTTIEFSADGACVRAVGMRGPAQGSTAPMQLQALPDGRYEGYEDLGSSRGRITCTQQPE